MGDKMEIKNKKTIIYGCGDMGIQTYNILKHDSNIVIIGFLDDDSKDSTFLGLPILGGQNSIDKIKKDHKITHGIVTIGDNQIRSEKTVDVFPELEPILNGA